MKSNKAPTSLDFLQAVYLNESLPINVRIRAAESALPFEHPKLAVTALVNGEAIGRALEGALKRSGKLIERSPPIIEHRNRTEPN